MSADNIELEPCPFCGAQPLLDHACLVRTTYWWVRCQNLEGCKVLPHGMHCLKPASACAAWNQRIVTHADHLRAELAVAGDMLRALKKRNDELNDELADLRKRTDSK